MNKIDLLYSLNFSLIQIYQAMTGFTWKTIKHKLNKHLRELLTFKNVECTYILNGLQTTETEFNSNLELTVHKYKTYKEYKYEISDWIFTKILYFDKRGQCGYKFEWVNGQPSSIFYFVDNQNINNIIKRIFRK